MNREEYIKQVKKKLYLKRELKQEILSNLEETFNCAIENNDSEASVIKRLGSPENFSKDVIQNFNISSEQMILIKRKKLISITSLITFVLAIICTVPLILENIEKSKYIGYSNAPTDILLANGLILPVVVCSFFWILFVVFIIYNFILSKKL